MIQITKWLEPNEDTWYQGTYITVYEWLMLEKLVNGKGLIDTV